MARPTKYNKKYCDKVKKLAEKGFTDIEMAELMDISEKTFYIWKEKYPEFLQAIKNGKELPDDTVERSLFERATGYSHKAIKIFCSKNGKVTKVKYIEHYPPDTASMIFWLTNRRREKWQNRRHTEISGENGGPVKVQQLTNEELEAEIAKAEAELADTKPGKGKKPK